MWLGNPGSQGLDPDPLDLGAKDLEYVLFDKTRVFVCSARYLDSGKLGSSQDDENYVTCQNAR